MVTVSRVVLTGTCITRPGIVEIGKFIAEIYDTIG